MACNPPAAVRADAAAHRWAYSYLQSRMESIDRHGWAHDCDGEIEARIAARSAGDEMSDQTASIWYSCNDSESRYEAQVPAFWIERGEPWYDDCAERCADDYHSNHDGWESVWPRTFKLYATEDGPALAAFEVDREARPEFIASPVPL